MGFTLAATSKAADAPDIESGVYDARFEGLSIKRIKGGQYQHDPDGDDNFEWLFTLLGDDGQALYEDGDPIEVTGLTSMSTNIASKTTPKAVRYLKAIMSPGEFASFEAGESVDADALEGRLCQVEVAIKDSGWPSVVSVLPVRKRRASTRRNSDADVE